MKERPSVLSEEEKEKLRKDIVSNGGIVKDPGFVELEKYLQRNPTDVFLKDNK